MIDLRRIRLFLIVVVCLLLLLAGRLFYIQITGHEALSEAARSQQRIRLSGLDRRGVIYDRNGRALTGLAAEFVYITPAGRTDAEFGKKMEMLGAEPRGGAYDYAIYAGSRYDEEAAEELAAAYGTYIVESARRYDDAQTAAHIIGYVNAYDNCGVSGVEYELDAILRSAGQNVYGIADRTGAFLPGMPLEYEDDTAHGAQSGDVTLTLDIDLQRAAEKALFESGYNGAVVILDTQSAGILALASAPAYNPNKVRDYLDSTGSELLNKCTQGEYPPGSVFKIVVAAAAFEYGVCGASGNPITQESVFRCQGQETLSGITIGCSTGGEEGHGDLTLRDAFAESCNCAFVQLGQLVGRERILATAARMGLGDVPIAELSGARSGRLTGLENAAGDGIGNLSIGQGELLVTPLQIARLTNLVALSGNDVDLSLLKTPEVSQKKIRRAISRETAANLRQMMEETVMSGTARGEGARYAAAGKTGSAESTLAGRNAVHGWFTGFFPASDPKYTITVFTENGRSGRATAVPIFEEIAAAIEAQGK